MKTFLILYLAPTSVIDAWSKTEPEKRKGAEDSMRRDWSTWMTTHADLLSDTKACGKTKRISSGGVSDCRNDLMLYSIAKAQSHEEIARAFEGHPHLQIPQSSIEIMEISELSGL